MVENKYRDYFCKLLEDTSLSDTTALEFLTNLKQCTDKFKLEILENLVNFKTTDEKNSYRKLIVEKINNNYQNWDNKISDIHPYLNRFNISEQELIKNYEHIKNPDFNTLLDTLYKDEKRGSVLGNEIYHTSFIFTEFFKKYYYREITTLLEEQTEESVKPVYNSKLKQLTANQIVLLLDRVGVFNSPGIEDAPKTKKADLVSQITGLHSKNLKKCIENLEKLPKEQGVNYQKDIDKIDQILASLN